MAQEDVELVQRMLDHFYNGEAEQALECFSPDVEIDLRRRVDAGWGRGREELARLIGEWVSSFADWREEINEVRDLGDQVLVEATQRGRGRESGVELESRYSTVYDVREGAIWRITLYPDATEARD